MTASPLERARRERRLTVVLLVLLVLGVLALGRGLRVRFDLTEERLASLHPATHDLLDRLDDRLQLKLYMNRDVEGAEELLPLRLQIVDLLQELERAGAPWVELDVVDPTTDLVAKRDAEHAGVQPLQLTGGDVAGVRVQLLYQGLEMRYRDRTAVIPFVVPGELEFGFATRLDALLADERPRIAFFSREPPLGPPIPGAPRHVPPARVFEGLRRVLGDRYLVEDVDLTDPAWRDARTRALVVARPQEVTAAEAEAVAAYLHDGGHVLVLLEGEEVDPVSFVREPLDPGLLDDWLAALGIGVTRGLVYDERCLSIKVGEDWVDTPQGRQGVPLMLPYGLFPVVTGDGLNQDHVVTGSLGQVVLFWAHAVTPRELPPGVTSEVLLWSSERSWLLPGDTPLARTKENLEKLQAFTRQFGAPTSHPLATAFRGPFPAWSADEDADEVEAAGEAAAAGDDDAAAEAVSAAADGREGVLVVVGDSDLFHRVVLDNQEVGPPNAEFAANLLDWLAQAPALISLRSRGSRPRPIPDFAVEWWQAHGGPTADEEEARILDRQARAHARRLQRFIGWGNVVGPAFVVLLLALLWRSHRRRRAARPFPGARAAGGGPS